MTPVPKDDNRPFVVSRLHAKWALDAKRLVVRHKNPEHPLYLADSDEGKEGRIAHYMIGRDWKTKIGGNYETWTEDMILDLVDDPDWEVFVYDKAFDYL